MARREAPATDLATISPQEFPTPEKATRWLTEHDAAVHRARGWPVAGATVVYFVVTGVLLSVAPDLFAVHRRMHRRHSPGRCGRHCEMRDLWLYSYLCARTVCEPRAMPFSPICALLFSEWFDWKAMNPQKFHDAVFRDAKPLSDALAQPRRGRSPAQRRLLLRYAGSAVVFQRPAPATDTHPTSHKNNLPLN